MHGNQSHGRLAAILATLSILVGLGFGSGIWFSNQEDQRQQQNEGKLILGQLAAQGQLLAENMGQEIEAIRAHSWRLGRGDRTSEGFGQILYWVEFEIQENGFRKILQVVRNPLWTVPSRVVGNYLRSTLQSLNVKEARDRGVSILRIQQDRNTSREWLNFVFPFFTPSSSVSVTPNKSVNATFVLALVDPSQAFSVFRNWHNHSDEGRSRSYLLGADGRVLAHSQPSLAFSDLSQFPLFRNGVRQLFGEPSLPGGRGEFEGIDHLPVLAAYFRVGKLPLSLVVEEVDRRSHEWFFSQSFWEAGFFVLTLLSVAVLSCALFLKTCLVPKIVQSVAVQKFQGIPPPIPVQTQNTQDFFSGNELLILNEQAEFKPKTERNPDTIL